MAASQQARTGGMAAPAGPVPHSLSVDDCHALLAAGRIGRVVFETADGLASLAVSYAMAGRVVLLRTGADTELAARAAWLDCLVSFEVDRPGAGWSVLVTGRAARVRSGNQAHQLAAQTGLPPWPDGGREVYLQITPYWITGQRVCG